MASELAADAITWRLANATDDPAAAVERPFNPAELGASALPGTAFTAGDAGTYVLRLFPGSEVRAAAVHYGASALRLAFASVEGTRFADVPVVQRDFTIFGPNAVVAAPEDPAAPKGPGAPTFEGWVNVLQPVEAISEGKIVGTWNAAVND